MPMANAIEVDSEKCKLCRLKVFPHVEGSPYRIHPAETVLAGYEVHLETGLGMIYEYDVRATALPSFGNNRDAAKAAMDFERKKAMYFSTFRTKLAELRMKRRRFVAASGPQDGWELDFWD